MRIIRIAHRWLGILLALPLVLQGLSGAILTLEPALPHWGSAVRAGVPAPANAILDAARAAAPAGMRPARYAPPEQQGDPATVQLAPPGVRGPGLLLSLDPVTATPLGPPQPASGAMEWLKRLHTNLLVPEWGGRQVVGWLGVGLLAITLIGIPLWWPARGQARAAFTVPRGARGTRLYRSLHGAAGIWLLVMMLATSTTGIVQGFPQTTRAVLGLPTNGPPRPGRVAPGAPIPAPDLDAAIALAQGAAPGTALRMAMLPASPAEPIRLFLGPPGTEGVTTATIVTVDAGVTKVLSVSAGNTVPAAEQVLRWSHDLHFGQGFGPVWRGLTVAVGLALPLFGFTGIAMWLAKRRNRRRVQTMRDAATQGRA